MRVSWYEQSQTGVGSGEDWLSEWERAHLHTLKIPKRRADWLLGRWTAKLGIADYLHMPAELTDLCAIEIRPDATGAPEAFIGGVPADVAISLSHRDGHGACAIADVAAKLGCDLEAVEARSPAFVADYFTSKEQGIVEGARSAERFATIALIWSAKESALKALRIGLRCDTRAVSVELASAAEVEPTNLQICSPAISADGWRRFAVTYSRTNTFQGLWCSSGGFIRTLVATSS
jgi:4'-phosphopantetheinyl transferase